MAETIAPDVVKYDADEKGSAETEFVRQGIPTVTFDIGRPGIWQTELIERGYQSVYRVLAGLQMLTTSTRLVASSAKQFLGNQFITLRATACGYVELYVSLLDDVKLGQLLARQINAFGDMVAEYKAPHDGRVLSIGDARFVSQEPLSFESSVGIRRNHASKVAEILVKQQVQGSRYSPLHLAHRRLQSLER